MLAIPGGASVDRSGDVPLRLRPRVGFLAVQLLRRIRPITDQQQRSRDPDAQMGEEEKRTEDNYPNRRFTSSQLIVLNQAAR